SFMDVVTLPSADNPIKQYELFKINKTVDDLYQYLEELMAVVGPLNDSPTSKQLRWYFDGKEAVVNLLQKMEEIDSLIADLLDVTGHLEDPSIASLLLAKLEDTSNLLVDIKKHVSTLRKHVNFAVRFTEIDRMVIKSLEAEIDLCMVSFSGLAEWKISSSKPEYDLENVITKMRINDLAFNTSNDSMRSMRLPTFNDFDDTFYDNYLALLQRLEPLSISLGILPFQIEEFNKMLGTSFPEARLDISTKHDNLVSKWEAMNKEISILKRDCLDTKWHELFEFLINEINTKCELMITGTPKNQSPRISQELNSTYKLCSNAITLIDKAFKESIIYEKPLASKFNDILLPKWQSVNDALALPVRSRTPRSVSASSTPRAENPRNEECNNRPSTPPQREKVGLGLDLGLDIETTAIPFSIQKKDRTKNLSNNYRTKKLRYSLALTNTPLYENEDDDELTLVVKSPNLKMDIDSLNSSISRLKVKKEDTLAREFNAQRFLSDLCNNLPQKASRIPMIQSDYIQSGLRVLKKKYSEKPSMLPTISPDHPVFQSPERQQLKSPLHTKRESRHLGSPLRSPSTFKRALDNEEGLLGGFHRNYRTSISPSLLEMKVPKLTYDKNYHISVERPFSSLGSRFDDHNLV
ncbi:karyogamy protein, partial [Suhomyces tanzawaensis NRRL Y-17324]